MASTLTAKEAKHLRTVLASLDKVPAPKGAKRSRRGRSRRQAKRENASVSLSAPGVQGVYYQPSKMTIRRRNWSEQYAVGNTQYGDQIVGLRGSQVLTTVANAAGAALLLNTSNSMSISPDSISGTLAGIANRFNKYFFKRLCFEYVPYQPNSTDGHGFYFGFNLEAGTEFTINTANVATLEHSMVVPMTGFLGGPEMNTLEVIPSRKVNPWYWNEDDTATLAGGRQTVQGTFYGIADSAITNATTWGTLWLHYDVEFCDLTPDQGFTMRGLSRKAKELSLKEWNSLWKEAQSGGKDDEREDWDRLSAGPTLRRS